LTEAADKKKPERAEPGRKRRTKGGPQKQGKDSLVGGTKRLKAPRSADTYVVEKVVLRGQQEQRKNKT